MVAVTSGSPWDAVRSILGDGPQDFMTMFLRSRSARAQYGVVAIREDEEGLHILLNDQQGRERARLLLGLDGAWKLRITGQDGQSALTLPTIP